MIFKYIRKVGSSRVAITELLAEIEKTFPPDDRIYINTSSMQLWIRLLTADTAYFFDLHINGLDIIVKIFTTVDDSFVPEIRKQCSDLLLRCGYEYSNGMDTMEDYDEMGILICDLIDLVIMKSLTYYGKIDKEKILKMNNYFSDQLKVRLDLIT